MKILAMDIGAGTQDILLYDDAKNIENCIKMVLPSSSQILAERVRRATERRESLFIRGDIIGGGAFSSALRSHLENGLSVVMSENAAYTVRNDLDQVRDLGIKVTQGETVPEGFEGETLTIEELNLGRIQMFLRGFNESLVDLDAVAIAVQDHGVFPRDTSNRSFRIKMIKELLTENSRLEKLIFREGETPTPFLRMRSAMKASRRQLPETEVLVMDTSHAAILGCLRDPRVEDADPVLAVNVGNGHTIGGIVEGGEIKGVVEHHTRLLTPLKMERLLVKFGAGKLTNEEVFNDGGHGLVFLGEESRFAEIEVVAVTGPNRKIIGETGITALFAAPAGDVMMTGTVGLVYAALNRIKK